MDFVNETPLPAVFTRGSTSDREMVGVVVAKLTCRVEDGRLVRCPDEEAWPVFEQRHTIAGVTLNEETDFRKTGTDVLVLGNAVAPGADPVTQMRVGIYCGAIRYELDVIGDRVWQKTAGGVMPSAPLPFRTMPLTNDRAFGGVAVHDGVPIPHSVNPVGRGFALTAEGAVDRPLPNLERPASRIQAWSDRPAPACLFRTSAPHIEPEVMEREPHHIAAHLMEQFGCDGPPELHAAPGQLGRELVLHGFDAQQLVFPLPPYHGPDVSVRVGPHRSRFPTSIATVVVLVEQRALAVTYRSVFRYLFSPGEERHTTLAWRSRSQLLPESARQPQ